jgi:signal transduction histidine kinase
MSESQTKDRLRRRLFTRSTALWTSVSTLAALIFVADTITSLEIAVAVLYVVVVLVSVRSGRPRAVMLVGMGCAVLTVASFLLSRNGAFGTGVANCILSLLAIGATTVLTIRMEVAGAAARRAQAVAHEVSQPLAAIVANSGAAMRWLSRSQGYDVEVRLALERIVEDADRAGMVISRVRNLVRRAPPAAEHIDLGALILDSLALLNREIQQNRIQLQTQLTANLPLVRGDRVQLQQVILNLMMNAIEALSDTPAAMRDLVVGTTADARTVDVSVRDGGVGLMPGAMDLVFEPFYTTKADGMGVGLSISRSIVEAHRGTVYVRAGHPRGTIVGFSLPLAANGEG